MHAQLTETLAAPPPEKTSKTVVYDADCGLCRAAARLAVLTRLIEPETLRPYESFRATGLQKRLDGEGFRNEMVVFRQSDGALRRGYEAWVWLLDDGWTRPLAWMMRLPGVPLVGRLVYRLIAYNRRLLAPPSRPGCACEPDERRGYRFVLLVVLALFSTLVTAAFGAAAGWAGWVPRAWPAAAWMLAATGCGWIAAMANGLRLPPSRRLGYLGHLAVTMALGVLPLLPAIAAASLGPLPFAVTAAAGVAASMTLMVRSQLRRLERQGLGHGWLAAWATCLVLGVVLTTAEYLLTRSLPW